MHLCFMTQLPPGSSLFPPVSLSNRELLRSPGSCRKQRRVFNEDLPLKGILNKQMWHLAASPADFPKIYTAIIYSFCKLHFIIFKVDNGKKNSIGQHLYEASPGSVHQMSPCCLASRVAVHRAHSQAPYIPETIPILSPLLRCPSNIPSSWPHRRSPPRDTTFTLPRAPRHGWHAFSHH